MELASKRIQMSGENIDSYRAALEKIWQEFKQTSPADLNAAVQTAKIHYRAIREEMQPSSSVEINKAMAGEIKQLKERLDSFERKPRTPFQPQ
ncbi:1917_t:CDS:2 [Paraglomus brasilianum]|uniref:1917_t:CDS:1 n=1 Tax=Paraglomus brasilianum TaxID=144538 RepID=A0A9N9ECV2_9GLOM|nr:1917_t:CDS:2 [Paraglomus brasilianum]